MKTVPTIALILLAATLAQAQEPRVVVVGIDAKTQQELGPFGGSYRALHAKLIEKLNASGAKAITFDVFFPENPDQAAETTLSRAGVADRKRLEELGLIEQVTVGWNGAPVQVPALRPQLSKKPLTLSYADVLRKKPHPALKGAIVIVGMTDGVQDMQENPDPSKPDLEQISGVYLHAALAQRVVREVAADDAKRAKAKAEAKAGLGSATRGAGLGINEVLKGKLGEKSSKDD